MSDNLTLNVGTGGATLATDDIGGTHYQIVKVSFGALDTATPVSAANPLPVVQTGTHTVTGAGGTFPVTGTVSITANSAVNVAQVNGVTTLMGNGVTGTGSQRVTIASDNTAFSVNAVQSGTWSVRNQDGTGNAITSATRGSERALTVQVVDASGAQVTSFSGSGTASAVSSVNSTAVVLAGGATFTGTSEDITAYASVSVSVIASHASATDGLSMQQSSDGTNWDIADTYTVPAATGKTFGVQVAAKFFRLVYTNGATLQTSFRLQTIYHTIMPVSSSVRPQDARTNDNDMAEVISYSALFNGTTWDRMRGDITNGLDVDVTRVPTDPFGANADAASSTGSISAKLRFIAATGIPITGTASTNVAQLAGTTTDTNSGVKSAGTLRVVLATDQPALTNKLLVTPDSVALPANQSVNVSQINAVTPLMGNGVTGTGSQRVTIASDNTAFTVNAAQSGTWTVQPGNTANTTAWLSSLRPGTSGGLTTFHLVSAATTNATNIKASAGQVFGWYIYNSNAAARKVVFHNNAGAPTAGAGVIFAIMIPPTSAANVFSDIGIPFATGIAITTVTDLTDAGTTAVALNDLIINIFYA